MSVAMDGIMAVFSPPSDKKSLLIAVAEEGTTDALNQLVFAPLWQAFAVNEVMNNPPSGTICNGTVYVVYPSTAQDTSSAFCYTCTGTTWSGPTVLTEVLTNCGMSAVTYNGTPYAFYQGTTLNMKNSGQMFAKQLPSGSYWGVLGEQVIMSNIPSAVAFNGEVYVFYQGPGNDEQVWFTHTSDISSGNWAASTQVPNIGVASSGSPGAVVFNNQAYIFYPSSNTNNSMYYRGMNTAGAWGTEGNISAVSMTGKPSPLVYNDVLYVFYEGSGGGTMWYISSTDAVNWTAPVQLAMTGISAAPYLIVYNSQLLCFMQGPGDDSQLWNCIITPGETNSFMARITNGGLSWSPGVAVYNNQVFAFIQGTGESGAMYCCIGDSNGWQPAIQIVGEAGMTGSPAPVVYNDVLYVFSQGGAYAGNLLYNTYSPSSGWSAQQEVVRGAGMSGWPGPVVWNNQMYVFYEGKGNANGVWYSVMSSDGSWSNSMQMNTSGVTYSNQTGSNHAGTSAPCGVVYNGILYVGYLANSGYIYITEFSSDGSSNGNPVAIGGNASCSMSFAVLDGVLYMAYQNETSGQLFYRVNSGDPCNSADWGPGIQLGAAPSSSAPGAFTAWTEDAISCVQMF